MEGRMRVVDLADGERLLAELVEDHRESVPVKGQILVCQRVGLAGCDLAECKKAGR
jgi:hypothetical protein